MVMLFVMGAFKTNSGLLLIIGLISLKKLVNTLVKEITFLAFCFDFFEQFRLLYILEKCTDFLDLSIFASNFGCDLGCPHLFFGPLIGMGVLASNEKWVFILLRGVLQLVVVLVRYGEQYLAKKYKVHSLGGVA